MPTLKRIYSAFKRNRKNIVLLTLATILICAFLFEVVFAEGPSAFGDDIVYVNYAYSVVMGKFAEVAGDVFSLRLLNIFPIAFFFALFGYSNLTSAMWAILTFLGSIVIAFVIGKELYNEFTGLVAAFLTSIFPLFAILAETPTPNVPEAFFAGLVMLGIIMARKKNSKLWYFLTGVLLVATPLTTPLAAIIFVVLFVYLLVDLLRKKFRINRVSAYLAYGILSGVLLLVLFNYINSGSPFITFTATEQIYSTAGTPDKGVLINTDLGFYFASMFSYGIIRILKSSILTGNLSPLSMWQGIYFNNYSTVGFFFYALVLAALYLVVTKERKAYLPLLWFGVTFLSLEFGPIYVSLIPPKYILLHRLGRYMTVLGIPMALAMAVAVTRLVENSWRLRKWRGWMPNRNAAMLVSFAFLAFLTATSLPVILFWHAVVNYQTYDLTSIANYLTALPGSTQIYFGSAYSSLPFHMQYFNFSRFHVDDVMSNCSSVPSGSYVLLPKNYQVGAPGPVSILYACPNWNAVFTPQIPGNYSAAISGPGLVFGARLLYVK